MLTEGNALFSVFLVLSAVAAIQVAVCLLIIICNGWQILQYLKSSSRGSNGSTNQLTDVFVWPALPSYEESQILVHQYRTQLSRYDETQRYCNDQRQFERHIACHEQSQRHIDGHEQSQRQLDDQERAQRHIDGHEQSQRQFDDQEQAQRHIDGHEQSQRQLDDQEQTQRHIDGHEQFQRHIVDHMQSEIHIDGLEHAKGHNDQEQSQRNLNEQEELQNNHGQLENSQSYLESPACSNSHLNLDSSLRQQDCPDQPLRNIGDQEEPQRNLKYHKLRKGIVCSSSKDPKTYPNFPKDILTVTSSPIISQRYFDIHEQSQDMVMDICSPVILRDVSTTKMSPKDIPMEKNVPQVSKGTCWRLSLNGRAQGHTDEPIYDI